MRIVLQRVSRAEVSVREADGSSRRAGQIDRGFLLLVGFTHDDTEEKLAWMADKVVGLRLFADADGKMNLALDDVGGALSSCRNSRSTAMPKKGRGRASSTLRAPRSPFRCTSVSLRCCGSAAARRDRGVRRDMDVSLVNEGPVTLLLER